MVWAIIKCVQVLFASAIVAFCWVSTTNAWSATIAPNFITSEVKTTNTYPCGGEYRDVSIYEGSTVQACVMGVQISIASYFPSAGPIAYLVSFPFDDTFYKLDVCLGYWGCVYNEKTDTLIGFERGARQEVKAVIFKQFSRHLKKVVQPGGISYSLDATEGRFTIDYPENLNIYVQSLAASTNGKWLVLELREYGVLRVNLESLDVRRIAAPGYAYTNYGPQASVEMAVSNDGKALAFMGARVGFSIISINEHCGDRLDSATQTAFNSSVAICPYVNIQPNTYISQFSHGLKPRFSEDSSMLSFDAYGAHYTSKHVTLFSDDTATRNVKYYLALGDSFTSGEGELDDSFYLGGAGYTCHVSSRSYPYLFSNKIGYPSVHNAGCSGATMDTARLSKAKDDTPSQLAELEVRQPRFVTVGIGGNDAGLMGKLKTCLGFDTCEWASSAPERAKSATEIKNLYPKLRAFYQDVKMKTLDKAIVVGYPKIISEDNVCFTEIGALLNQTERKFINEAIVYLNQVIQSASNDSGLDFVSVEDVFVGSELCSLGPISSMNGLRFGNDYSVIDALPHLKLFGTESFHPTPTGHEKVANRLFNQFSDVFSTTECLTCSGFKGPPSPSAYWEGEPDAPGRRQAVSFLDKLNVKNREMFQIFLPSLSFLPQSEVIIEMHSQAKEIERVSASSDGGVNIAIQANNFEPGHHTIHVLGTSTTGRPIDVYDFMSVDADSDSTPSATTDTVEDRQSTQKTAKQPSSTNTATLNKTNSVTVLGASTASMPILSMSIPLKERAREKPVQKDSAKINTMIFLYSLAIITVIALCLTLYLLNRKKQP